LVSTIPQGRSRRLSTHFKICLPLLHH
jgi:hypothetical protein